MLLAMNSCGRVTCVSEEFDEIERFSKTFFADIRSVMSKLIQIAPMMLPLSSQINGRRSQNAAVFN